MKKICLTILLSFLIVFSGGTLTFAEDYIDGGIYKDSTAPLLTNTYTYINTYFEAVGTPMYFRLIPAMTDTYTIETTGTVDTEGELYDASGNSLDISDDVVGTNFQIHRELIGGETYYLRVTNWTGLAGDQTILRIIGDAGGNLSDPDNTAPAGYSAAIDQVLINNANQEAMSFTFSGAEVGAAYNYTISSSGGGENVTGSGTIISNDQQITGIDVSGLSDGTITLSVTLTDQDGNTGTASTDTVPKETANATSATAAQLAAALGSNAIASGNTVTLTGDVADVAATIEIEPSENITLDLAGYTINGKNGTYMDNGITPLEIIGGTSTLTITGSGMILGGSVELFDAADAVSISGGKVIIENASIIGGVSNHGSGYHSCGDGIEISSGSLTIKDGAIKGGVDPGRGNYAGHGLNLMGGTVTIYGGSFYSGADLWNNSKAIYASSGTVADIITAGKIMKSYNDEEFTTGEAVIANDTLLSALTSKYIRVQAPVVNAESPVITNDLSTVQVEYRKNAAAVPLNATAAVTDDGTITYAWYSNTISSTDGATALGVTTATYTPSTAAVGTTYYFCVVTNTNNAATGATTAQTTSAIASIKVKAVGGGGGGGGGSDHSSTVPETPVITVPEVKSEPAKPWANPFSDVKASDWYYTAVQYAAQNGLMKGTGSDTFSPESVTTRGMIVTILYNLDGSGETEQSSFKDVQPGAYYANAAAWAEKKGIIAGYGSQMFGPDDKITREQLAVMLWKYAGSPAADSKGLAYFKDAGEISAYAQSALAWANQEGIINGKGGGLLDPKGQATRAEAAQIMQNFLQK